jgi:hypothetical protein
MMSTLSTLIASYLASERGPRTLEQLRSIAAGHITHHLQFVVEKRKTLGLSA